MQEDEELSAVVRNRQLHIYRNNKKILVLAGKAQPKVIRADKLNAIFSTDNEESYAKKRPMPDSDRQ